MRMAVLKLSHALPTLFHDFMIVLLLGFRSS
jgi:hypothetical protein